MSPYEDIGFPIAVIVILASWWYCWYKKKCCYSESSSSSSSNNEAIRETPHHRRRHRNTADGQNDTSIVPPTIEMQGQMPTYYQPPYVPAANYANPYAYPNAVSDPNALPAPPEYYQYPMAGTAVYPTNPVDQPQNPNSEISADDFPSVVPITQV